MKNAKNALDSAQVNLDSAKISVETQKTNIQTAETSLNTQRSSLEETTITASISGVIDEKNVSLGQYLIIGTVLGKIENTSSIYAVIQVKNSDLSYVKTDTKAILKLDERY